MDEYKQYEKPYEAVIRFISILLLISIGLCINKGIQAAPKNATLEVSSVSPTSGTINGGTEVTISGNNISDGAIVYFGADQSASVTYIRKTKLTAVTPAYVEGAVDVEVINPDGTSAKLYGAYTYVNNSQKDPILDITIEYPLEGENITAKKVNVSGSFVGMENSAIAIGKIEPFSEPVCAIIEGNRFYANNVRLPNSDVAIITATVTSPPPSEGFLSKEITINSTHQKAAITVGVDQDKGLSPFNPEFVVDTTVATSKLIIDFESDGTVDQIVDSPSFPVTVNTSYVTPGIYKPRFSLLDANDAVLSSKDLVIEVADKNYIDSISRSLFDNLNAALIAGDINTAAKYFSIQTRDKYSDIYSKIIDDLPQIISSYQPLAEREIDVDSSTYYLFRYIDGVKKAYIVKFLRDQDCVWRIYSM